jgi:thiamine kinase-like enzyme
LALIEEFIHGKDLDYYLRNAIYRGNYSLLRNKLSILANFLYVLHHKTEIAEPVAMDEVARYFLRIINKLLTQGILSEHERKSYLRLMEKWFLKGYLEQARRVIVHGDATPTNFLFTEGGDIVAIDLERSRSADPVFDVSMVCGELKHAFMWRTGNPYAAEPWIRHFLKSYTQHFPCARKAFREITMRNPFYMALTELRIARNTYLDRNYRQRLAFEARQCLKWGLMLQ